LSKRQPGEKAGDPQARPVIGAKELDFTIKTLQAAQKQRKSKGQKDAEHIRLYTTLMDSRAWLALSCAARVAYLEFLRVWWRTRNKNSLEVSYSWLKEKQGIADRAAARSYVELESLGFIEGPKTEERGGLFGRVCIYKLSTRWQTLENDPAALKKAGAAIVAFDRKRGRPRRAEYTQTRFEKLSDGGARGRTLNNGPKRTKSREAEPTSGIY